MGEIYSTGVMQTKGGARHWFSSVQKKNGKYDLYEVTDLNGVPKGEPFTKNVLRDDIDKRITSRHERAKDIQQAEKKSQKEGITHEERMEMADYNPDEM